jgi:autotransporter-associated beta strand protein
MNPLKRMIRGCLLIAAIVGIQAFCGNATPSFAAPIGNATWTGGGGSGNWSTSSNWSTIPTTSGSWNLVFGGTTQTTSTNNIGTITLGTMSFTNNGSAGQTATFTLSGSTLALSNATIITTATSGASALAGPGETIANALTLAGSNSVLLGAGHSISLTTGGLSGAGSITYDSSGGTPYVYLSGSNSYSGNTYIKGGSTYTSTSSGSSGFNSDAFGTGSVFVSGSGSVFVRNNSNLANNFSIGGQGATSNGTPVGAIRGSFGTVGQVATLSGTVSLSSDALITTAATLGGTGSKLLLSGPVGLGSYTLTLRPSLAGTGTAAVPIELSGNVSGSGLVIVDGTAGSYVLMSGTNSYSGGTRISQGTLVVGSSSAVGTGSLAVNGGILDLNGQSLSVGLLSGSSGGLIRSSVVGAAMLSTSSASSATYAGSIVDGAGVVGLTKAGGGTIFMTGSNGYSGTTYITGGKIQTGSSFVDSTSNNNAFGTGSVVVSGSGGLAVRNSSTVSNNLTISGTGAGSGAIRGSFGGTGQTAVVSGSVTLAGDASIVTAASSGLTDNKLILSGPINIGSYNLTLTPGASSVVARFSDAAAAPIVLTGTMVGSGNTTVNGVSAVYVNGLNASTGATTVKSGALGGNGSIAGVVTVENGATLTPGSAANTTGSLSVGGLQLNSGAAAEMMISGTAVGLYDQVVATNNVAYGGVLAIDFATSGFADFDVWQLFSGDSHSGNFSSVSASGAYGSLTFSYLGSGEWQATGGLLAQGQSLSFYEDNSHAIGGRYQAGQLVLVPEPSTMVVAGIGLFVLGCSYWKKRRTLCSGYVDLASQAESV